MAVVAAVAVDQCARGCVGSSLRCASGSVDVMRAAWPARAGTTTRLACAGAATRAFAANGTPAFAAGTLRCRVRCSMLRSQPPLSVHATTAMMAKPASTMTRINAKAFIANISARAVPT